MSILPITKDGDPVLRTVAKGVDPAELQSDRIKKLISDMVETMYAAKGVGIAAPQVGESLRIFIAESAEGPIALINPVLEKKSWKMRGGEEGCLSIPEKFDSVKRAKSVNVSALTPSGERVRFTADDFFARVLQHEMDHLDGILYVDRVKEQKKK